MSRLVIARAACSVQCAPPSPRRSKHRSALYGSRRRHTSSGSSFKRNQPGSTAARKRRSGIENRCICHDRADRLDSERERSSYPSLCIRFGCLRGASRSCTRLHCGRRWRPRLAQCSPPRYERPDLARHQRRSHDRVSEQGETVHRQLKVFGFYLWDEPDPTGKYGELITPGSLKEQSDWIHQNVPGAKTFIVLMNMASSNARPSYMNTYNPANTGIDLYGLDPYPFRTGLVADLNEIDAAVAAAVQSGIPMERIVPVFQAFGGGNFNTAEGGKYLVPTPKQLQALIDRWATIIPSPEFDFVYSWGNQQGDTALRNRPELQAVCKAHNSGGTALVTSPRANE